jgi:hypothetical protein
MSGYMHAAQIKKKEPMQQELSGYNFELYTSAGAQKCDKNK